MKEPRLRNHVLHSRSASAAADGAITVIDGVQTIPHPADQLIGMAVALKFMCDATGHSPDALFDLVERMESDCRFREVNTLSAVRKYAEHEVAQKLP